MNTPNVAGTISTTSSISTTVLSRRAGTVEGNEDVSLTSIANTHVLRYNKADDTYKADTRQLDGGSF
jgi:hypothetical protein|tara:strand:- start:270 stop:470 length:201 start_codon:yes stop_codon:yes gene_type:complete